VDSPEKPKQPPKKTLELDDLILFDEAGDYYIANRDDIDFYLCVEPNCEEWRVTNRPDMDGYCSKHRAANKLGNDPVKLTKQAVNLQKKIKKFNLKVTKETDQLAKLKKTYGDGISDEVLESYIKEREPVEDIGNELRKIKKTLKESKRLKRTKETV